jgi:hypothetical protein
LTELLARETKQAEYAYSLIESEVAVSDGIN